MKKIVALLCCMAMLIALYGCTNKDMVKEKLMGYLEEYEFATAYEFLQEQDEEILAYVEGDIVETLKDIFSHVKLDQFGQECVAAGAKIIKLLPSQNSEENQEVLKMYEMMLEHLQYLELWNEFNACNGEYGETVGLDAAILGKAISNLNADTWSEFKKTITDLDSISQRIRLNYNTNDTKCKAFLDAIETIVIGGNAMQSGQKMSDNSLWNDGKAKIIDGMEAMKELLGDSMKAQEKERDYTQFLLDILGETDLPEY